MALAKQKSASQETLEQLNAVLERARPAPFFRSKLPSAPLASLAEWQDLPFTTKEDLRASYPFGLLAVPRERVATYHESSGSSGEPTPSFFSEGDWRDITSRFLRNGVEVTAGDCVLVKTPYSLVTTAHQMHLAARARGAMVIPGDNRTANLPYPKVVRLLRDLEVTVAWCMPTEALLWAAAAQAAGLDPRTDFPALRALLVAGEALSPAKQKRISELWGGVRVWQDYGSTETGSLAGECRHGALHFWSDRLYPEVLDVTTGATRERGRGQLVVTPLFREAMPLVRYRLDDTVEISDEPCPCGSEYPTVRIFGRALSAARIQDRDLFASDLEDAVYSAPGESGALFWRARFDDRTLEIELDAATPRACADLRFRIARRFGIEAEVRPAPRPLVSPDFLRQTKPFLKPRFLFHRDEDWNQAIHY